MKRSWYVLAFVVIMTAGCAVLNSPGAEGCGPLALPTLPPEFEDFTPIEDQIGRPHWPLGSHSKRINSPDEVVGFDPLMPSSAPGDLPLQAMLVNQGGDYLTLLYAPDPVSAKEILPEFLARGGIVVNEKAVSGLSNAATVVSEIGLRAAVVEVGPHDAALVHADPIWSNETRPYSLYWDDGVRDWNVMGVTAAENLISFARDLHCQ
jgi:hypothetical protein